MKTAIGSAVFCLFCLMLPLSSASAGDSGPAPMPLSPKDLASFSGGAGATIGLSYQALSAANSGNSIETQSLVTGNVSLAPGSLGGFNGVGNFVFNTGNNNNLQGALSVTIMVPAAN